MKTIVCLTSLVTLVLASGCASHHGAAVGVQEYQTGNYSENPAPGRDAGYYFDSYGHYHEFHDGVDRVMWF